MTYRNMLAPLDRGPGARYRLEAAMVLGDRFSCPVVGTFLASSRLPDYMFSEVVSPMPQELVEAYIKAHGERIAAASGDAKGLFTGVAGKERQTRWIDLNGGGVEELAACARVHDLTILPPVIRPAFIDAEFSAAQIGMASGGPVLILKHGGYSLDLGGSVLIAWKGSREASRALRDAWPFLERAREIHFLMVGRGQAAPDGELLEQLLRDHGCCDPHIHLEESDSIPVEDLIRLHAAKTGASLIVLGLYGHSRLQEFVLGGVSRDLLIDPPMPLLMSH